MSQTVCQRSKQMLVGTRRKKIVVLSNQIVDIELTKLFFFLNEFSVFPTNLFVESTKEFVIAFCLTKIFVRRTKILLRRQKKVCRFYIFLRKGVTSGEYREQGKTSHFSVSKYVLTDLATCGRALSCLRITLSCPSWYCGSFSFNARLKRIPPNAEHNLGIVNIRSGRRRGGMSGHSP